MTRLPAIVLLCAALAGCSPGRPPWADARTVSEAVPAGELPPEYGNFAGRLLAVHNRERAALRIPPLTWDAGLAAAAARYGLELARRGDLVHSPAATRPGQGENLWMGTRARYSLERMVQLWADEKSLFRAGVFPNVSRSGKWSDVAHYTQMIWGATRSVGCALERGDKWDYLICRYAPAGNVVGQPVP